MAGGNRIGVESKKIVSYLPERPYFSPGMKVSETIKFFKDFYSDFSEDAAAEMLKSLEIKMDARIRTLSKVTGKRCSLYLL